MVWFDLGCLGWVVLLHSGWCVGCILLFGRWIVSCFVQVLLGFEGTFALCFVLLYYGLYLVNSVVIDCWV